jgi:stage II sporulation protein B
MSRTKITYRFDQQSPPKREESQEKGVIIPLHQKEYRVTEKVDPHPLKTFSPDPMFAGQPLNEFTKDFGAWSSPFDVETDELEQMIRETDRIPEDTTNEIPKQIPKTANRYDEMEQRENQYDASSGFYDRNIIGPEMSATRYIRRSGTPWGKIIMSISGAIITGVVFGMFVLSLFTDDGTPSEGTKSGQTDNNSAIVTETSNHDPSSLDTLIPQEEGTVSVDIPSQSFFILQNGVFSSKEGAEAAQQDLVSKGFAAVSEITDSYYVYAGISTSRDDALMISYQLQQQELETYIKTYSIPAIRQIYWQDEETADIENYFLQGNQLARMISNISVIQLQQPSAASIESTSMNSLVEAHQSWNNLSSKVYEGIPEEHKSKMDKVNNAMNTTMISLDAYRKNPSFSYLWQTQTALMEYIVLQKNLLSSLEVK